MSSSPAPSAVPTTVVFDLGGVLVDWDPRYLYRQLLPEDEVEDVPHRGRLRDVEPPRRTPGGRWADADAELAAALPAPGAS